ncbi:hypothetical protein [Azospirillum picis]|uniref:Uncharacterized protein n=1 Tax=Azospirillum picis TaxID=488438 RepID=A0ABU0MPD8_9PROT|nr:hypothetical protein [Azospirillum picis]MBP2301278.1 hypothetical protein [Azospirillum picis]MDQ0535109.1 hypothetical protein [Azospirillum picis]
MTYRAMPQPDGLVEIDIPAVAGAAIHTITRRVVTVRDHGDGRYTCLLSDTAGGALSTMTIAPAESGGWVGVQPPISIDGAVHVAQSVLAGVTLHRSINEQMRLLSEAVLLLTGQQRAVGRPVAARLARGAR